MALVKIQVRRDTAANWTASNPVLAVGEPGLETDTGKVKYGDGVRNWNTLPYSSGVSLGSSAPPAAGTAVAGTSETAARSDHSHALPSNLTASTVTTTGNASVGGSLTVSGPLVGGEHKHDSSSIADFSNAVFQRLAAALKSGTNVTTVVDPAAGTITLSAASGSSADPLAISSDPLDALSSDGLARFNARAVGGTGAITYQWEQSTGDDDTWTDIAGATGASLSRSGLTAANDGTKYRVRAMAGAETVRSLPATLRISAISITQQPADFIGAIGDFVFLQVAASAGTATLSYQWQTRPGSSSAWSDVPGATSATYTYRAGSATAASGVQFRAAVIAVGSIAHSRTATVVIEGEKLYVASHPQTTTDVAGAATFSSSWAGGVEPIAVRWQRLGGSSSTWSETSAFADIPDGASGVSGQSTGTLSLTGQGSTQHMRKYRLRLVDATGFTVFSDPANLKTLSLVITVNPLPLSVPSGTTIATDAFRVAATADGAITYQWQSSTNGGTTWTNIAGATSATYGGVTLASADSGKLFRCQVTGDGQTLPSAAAEVTVSPVAVTITTQPSNATIASGTATFTFAYTGGETGATPVIRWEKGTAEATPVSLGYISGATTTTLALGPGVPLTDNGQRVRGVVTIAGATATTNWAILTVPGVTFTTQPQGSTITGSTAEFSFAFTPTACGSPAIAWQRRASSSGSWTTISGETATTLSLASLVASDSGSQFRASVTCGTEVSYTNIATLTVLPPTLAISTQPLDATAALSQATFSFAFTGGDGTTPVIRWERIVGGLAWATIPGATSSTLTLTGITNVLDGSQYRAVVTVGAQSATTRAATLTVSNATITLQPSDTTTNNGNATLTFSYSTTACANAYTIWERAMPGTTAFEAIGGSDGKTTLSVQGLFPGQSVLYRAYVQCGSGPAVYTRIATVTATSYAVFVSQPVSQAVTVGNTVTLSFTTSLPPGTYTIKWGYSRDGGATYSEYVAGRNLSVISVTATAFYKGSKWRAELTSAVGGFVLTTTPAQLDVGISTSISQIPVVGAAEVNGVAYAKGWYVALTSDTTALCRRSRDGVNWTTAFLPSSRQWDAIVATSSGNIIAMSSGSLASTRALSGGTYVFRPSVGGVAAISRDGGATWQSLALPFWLGEMARMWHFPSHGVTVVAFAAEGGDATLATAPRYIYRRTQQYEGYSILWEGRNGVGKIAVSYNDGGSWSVFNIFDPPASQSWPKADYEYNDGVRLPSQIAVSPSGQVVALVRGLMYVDATSRLGQRTQTWTEYYPQMLYGSISGGSAGWGGLTPASTAVAAVYDPAKLGWTATGGGIYARPRSPAPPSGTPISNHQMSSVAHVAGKGFVAAHDLMPAIMISETGQTWGAVPASLAVGSLAFFDRGTEVLAVDSTRRITRLTASSYPNFQPTELTVANALDQVSAWASSGYEVLLTELAGRLTYIPSDTPRPVVVEGTPNAPENLQVQPTNGAIRLRWDAGLVKVAPDPYPTASNPTTGYVVQHRSSDSTEWITATGSYTAPTNPDSSSGGMWRLGGLTNGTTYVIRVAAVNSRGQSDWSTLSSPVIPNVVAPSPPASVSIASVSAARALLARDINIAFTPPADDGGAPITGYAAQLVNVGNGYRSAVFELAAGTGTRAFTQAVAAGTIVRVELLARNSANPAPLWAGNAAVSASFTVR